MSDWVELGESDGFVTIRLRIGEDPESPDLEVDQSFTIPEPLATPEEQIQQLGDAYLAGYLYQNPES